MGVAVGFVVGLVVGLKVGLAVSVTVGLTVGFEVGVAVGLMVGLAVSVTVGLTVGLVPLKETPLTMPVPVGGLCAVTRGSGAVGWGRLRTVRSPCSWVMSRRANTCSWTRGCPCRRSGRPTRRG